MINELKNGGGDQSLQNQALGVIKMNFNKMKKSVSLKMRQQP